MSEQHPGVTQSRSAPAFEVTTSRQFSSWLTELGAAFAVSTYQAGMVLFIGSDPQAPARPLWLFNRHIERCMGIAATRDRLAVVSLFQIIDCRNGHTGPDGAERDPLYVPQVAYFTGDVDAHDVAFAQDGTIIFANTLFSCVAAVSASHSFRPLWTPPFISRLAAEDRCHLNGIAMRDGALAFATMVSRSDVADGWRDQRTGGGVVYDTASSEIVASGLSMPHSPRWHDGRLWLLSAGTGEFGTVDLSTGTFTPIAFCPGYLRGLTFAGRFAIIGSSEPRQNKTFGDLPLQQRLDREGARARCGLFVVDTLTGDVVHWLRITGVIHELFEVAVIANVRKPQMIGFRSDEIRRTISIAPPG